MHAGGWRWHAFQLCHMASGVPIKAIVVWSDAHRPLLLCRQLSANMPSLDSKLVVKHVNEGGIESEPQHLTSWAVIRHQIGIRCDPVPFPSRCTCTGRCCNHKCIGHTLTAVHSLHTSSADLSINHVSTLSGAAEVDCDGFIKCASVINCMCRVA